MQVLQPVLNVLQQTLDVALLVFQPARNFVLDGHAFHDKDKKQRAYEKSRDRFLVKQGFRVLHFTGSEVVADPHKVAYEALDMLGVYGGSYREYDPQDPLGVGE